jgi:hypothetical protein
MEEETFAGGIIDVRQQSTKLEHGMREQIAGHIS